MFKSASTSKIGPPSTTKYDHRQDTHVGADCQINSYQPKQSTLEFRIRKEKQNQTQFQNSDQPSSRPQRREKCHLTWNQTLTENNHRSINLQTLTMPQRIKPASAIRDTLQPSENFLNTPKTEKGLLKSSKQCQSMRTLPNFEIEDENESYEKSKKHHKIEAYNELLKSSEQLISRYKAIERQKTQLKRDLKSQKEAHCKSHKKIVFFEEDKFCDKKSRAYPEKYTVIQNISDQRPFSKPPCRSTYESAFETRTYEEYKINVSKYSKGASSHLCKSSVNGSMNKTFSSKSLKHLNLDEKPSKTHNEGFGMSCKDQNKSKGSELSSDFVSDHTPGLKLCLGDFELGKSLGSGAFGEVFAARHKKTKMLFALKKIKKDSVKHMLDQFIQEIKIQLFLDHPNVVKLYGYFNDRSHFYILMEYMEGGSLYSYLKKAKTLEEAEISEKLHDICSGLKHMHDHQVLHRDIKPENIVLTHNVCKLCDFGWSAICKDRRTTYCGTLDYVSPEIIDGQGYDDSVDIWCIGVLAYELAVGKAPFYNISRKETMKKILEVIVWRCICRSSSKFRPKCLEKSDALFKRS